jgi:hypothetical protein
LRGAVKAFSAKSIFALRCYNIFLLQTVRFPR